MNFNEYFSRGNFDRLYYGSWIMTPKSSITEVNLTQPILEDQIKVLFDGIAYRRLSIH